uniref:Uncharacterized protein n=1 Tax=Arundo donax TaxID=35708 RepID=A0A0A9AFI9_ARUDO
MQTKILILLVLNHLI